MSIPPALMQFMPMIVIFALFYLLLIRPQQKKQKEHMAMLSALGKGDEVVTQGGLIGRITKLEEHVLTLEVSRDVEVRVQRGAVTGKL